MKRLKITVLFATLLGILSSVSAVAREVPITDDSRDSDGRIARLELDYSIMMAKNVRSVLVQSTLNCLYRKSSSENTERIDVILDLCFKIGRENAKTNSNASLKETLVINDVRLGRQDVIRTIMCLRDETKSVWRAAKISLNGTIEEATMLDGDMDKMVKCGFDPVLMGLKQLPQRKDEEMGQRMRLHPY